MRGGLLGNIDFSGIGDDGTALQSDPFAGTVFALNPDVGADTLFARQVGIQYGPQTYVPVQGPENYTAPASSSGDSKDYGAAVNNFVSRITNVFSTKAMPSSGVDIVGIRAEEAAVKKRAADAPDTSLDFSHKGSGDTKKFAAPIRVQGPSTVNSVASGIVAAVDSGAKAISETFHELVGGPDSKKSTDSVSPILRKSTQAAPVQKSGSFTQDFNAVINGVLSIITPITAAKQQRQAARGAQGSRGQKGSAGSAGAKSSSSSTGTYLLIGGGVLAAGLLIYAASKD